MVGRESLLQTGDDFSRLGYLLDDALTVAIQLVELDELAHLVVVGLRIRVYHLLGAFTSGHVVAEVIEHHVAVEYAALRFQGSLGKAVVVVPGLHVVDDGLDVGIGTD